MKIIVNKFIPFRGFICINLFGLLFTRYSFDRISPLVINHEGIHTKQYFEFTIALAIIFGLAVILGLSLWCLSIIPIAYYVWYVLEWFLRLLLQLATLFKAEAGKYKAHLHKAYRNVLFEQEAYKFQTDLDYLHRRKIFAWLRLSNVY